MDKAILEPIVENVAIKISSIIINTSKRGLEIVLNKTVGRTPAASQAIDKLLDGISDKVYDMVSDKIRKAIDFGHKEIVKPMIDKSPEDSRPGAKEEEHQKIGQPRELAASASLDSAKTALDQIEARLRERLASSQDRGPR
jgi:hypothetical protein